VGNQDRHRGTRQQVACHAAQHALAHPGVTVAAHHEQVAFQRGGAVQQGIGEMPGGLDLLDVCLDAVPQQPVVHLAGAQRALGTGVAFPKKRNQGDFGCLAQQRQCMVHGDRGLPAAVPGHQDPVQRTVEAAGARNDEHGPSRLQHHLFGELAHRVVDNGAFVGLAHDDEVAGAAKADHGAHRLAVDQPGVEGRQCRLRDTAAEHMRDGFGSPAQVKRRGGDAVLQLGVRRHGCRDALDAGRDDAHEMAGMPPGEPRRQKGADLATLGVVQVNGDGRERHAFPRAAATGALGLDRRGADPAASAV
jgi:hypothetical protein